MKLSRIIIAAAALCLFSLAASAQDSVMDTKGWKLLVNENQLPDIAIPDYIGQANYENTYVPAVKMYKAGLGLLIPGCVLSALGVVLITEAACESAIYSPLTGSWGTVSALTYSGMTTIIVGSAMLGTGAALYCIGKKRINWCADDYNSTHSQVSFNVSSGRNGIGLALNF